MKYLLSLEKYDNSKAPDNQVSADHEMLTIKLIFLAM